MFDLIKEELDDNMVSYKFTYQDKSVLYTETNDKVKLSLLDMMKYFVKFTEQRSYAIKEEILILENKKRNHEILKSVAELEISYLNKENQANYALVSKMVIYLSENPVKSLIS